jgi:hypothetical protein
MFHKLKSIESLPNYHLQAVFQNGEKRLYDVEPLFERWKPFRAFLLTPNLFDQAEVDTGGYGVVWNDELDLACEEIYQNGAAVL